MGGSVACGGGLVRGETYGGCTLDVLMVLRLITDLGGVYAGQRDVRQVGDVHAGVGVCLGPCMYMRVNIRNLFAAESVAAWQVDDVIPALGQAPALGKRRFWTGANVVQGLDFSTGWIAISASNATRKKGRASS